MRFDSKLDHPCKKDCPNRTALCKLSCAKFIKYEKERAEERQEQEEQKRRRLDYKTYHDEMVRKNLRTYRR